MKSFDVPIIYRSPLITAIKTRRKEMDKMKKDFTPTFLDFGSLQILLARHFGFCYGVENAIDISFKIVEENPGKRIFLLSEMIHNPQVNADLAAQGVKFIHDTYGNELIPFDELSVEDIIIIPAFGTTLEMVRKLEQAGIQTEKFDTTCPFVEKVWKRSEAIASKNYTVIIHGKPNHEETRATFSHASANAHSVIVRDMEQAIKLAKYITGEKPTAEFYREFAGLYSAGINAERDLQRIGVVNQTTMLASDTQAIADFFRQVIMNHFKLDESTIEERFADTRDTLCYATNDNQSAVTGMLQYSADLAIVIGGYNSSNTSHLVELCEEKLPTYFINDEVKILSDKQILHYDFHYKKEILSSDYIPINQPVKILITSGASCPDALVEGVIKKIVSFFPIEKTVEEMITQFKLKVES